MTIASPLPRAAAILLAVFAAGGAVAQASAWRVTLGAITILVPLLPGGGFEAETASLHGELRLEEGTPLALAGKLEVDLQTIDTGIELRNRHLRDNYLEVEKGDGFDTAVLSDLKLLDADGDAFEGRTGFVGMLLLHDTRKQIAGTAELRRTEAGMHVKASFPLELTDFGIQPPQYMGVGVGNRLLVEVVFVATPEKSR